MNPHTLKGPPGYGMTMLLFFISMALGPAQVPLPGGTNAVPGASTNTNTIPRREIPPRRIPLPPAGNTNLPGSVPPPGTVTTSGTNVSPTAASTNLSTRPVPLRIGTSTTTNVVVTPSANTTITTETRPGGPVPGTVVRTTTGVTNPPGNIPPNRLNAAFGTNTLATAGSSAASSNIAPDKNPDDIFPATAIRFQALAIDAFLDVYSEYVGRTVLRPANLPAQPITLRTQTPMTRREIVQALDGVLSLNGITMIPMGDKFVKAVLNTAAHPEAKEFSEGRLPDSGYVTHIVTLKFAKPADLVALLTPFQKTANAIFGLEGTPFLILRDYADNVKRMLEVVEKVDVIVPLEVKPVVIPIRYALASDIQQVLGSLTASGAGVSVGRRTATSGLPGAPGGTTGGINPATGQPITPTTAGAAGSLSANRSSFANRLAGIVNRAVQGSGDFQVLGTTKIIADERTNSLLIFANEQDIVMIKDIIEKLDVVLAQVLIEAIILEVSLDDSQNLGVNILQNPRERGSFRQGGLVNNNLGLLNTGRQFLNPGLATNVLAAAIPGIEGLSWFGNLGNDYEVAINAIARDGRVNVLSRPRIQTSHAVPANLFVGETVPYITGTFTDINGGARSQYQPQQIGITLNVKPLINPDGLVVMEIQQEIRQQGAPITIDGNPVPTTVDRIASATVSVHDRDTIILGGFISNSRTKTKSGVPILKDIPIIGAAFRSTSDSTKRTELIVLMRPTVLPTPEDAAVTAKDEKDQLLGIKLGEMELNEINEKRQKKIEAELKKKREKELKKQLGL